MPMAILGWGGGAGNRGDLRDIPNTNEAHINWCSWVRGDGVGEKGGGDMGGVNRSYIQLLHIVFVFRL